jgi:hypothetical protein
MEITLTIGKKNRNDSKWKENNYYHNRMLLRGKSVVVAVVGRELSLCCSFEFGEEKLQQLFTN